MSANYPIWNQITACIYSSGKSYGVKNTGEVSIKVGTSAKNSHDFLTHCVTKREVGDYLVFTFSVDGQIIKRAWLHNSKGAELLFSQPEELNQ